MVTQSTARPGQTTITRHTAPARIQGPMTTGPKLIPASVSQIRPGTTTIVQTNSLQQQTQTQLSQSQAPTQQQQQPSTTPPALQPVSVIYYIYIILYSISLF